MTVLEQDKELAGQMPAEEIAPASEPARPPDDAPPQAEAAQDSPAPALAAEAPTAEAEEGDKPPRVHVSDVEVSAVEAVLFSSDSPLSPARVAEVAMLEGGRRAARQAVLALNERYERVGTAFRVESVAGGYQMLTLPEHNELLGRLLKSRNDGKLSQPAMETLAIVAYKQPILRANVEAIRGVASGEMIRGLMEKGLVRIVGRAEELGRPMLYGTTKRFLEVFGLNDLKDLPPMAELPGRAPVALQPEPQAVSAEPPAAGDASPASATPPEAQTAAPDEPAPT